MDIVNPQVLEHQRDLGATAGGFPMSELLANHLSKVSLKIHNTWTPSQTIFITLN